MIFKQKIIILVLLTLVILALVVTQSPQTIKQSPQTNEEGISISFATETGPLHLIAINGVIWKMDTSGQEGPYVIHCNGFLSQGKIAITLTRFDDIAKLASCTQRLSIVGLAGNDLIIGGTNDDELTGDSGNDEISGMGGDDKINGGRDNDILKGGFGNDVIYGSWGDDNLNGEEGNDLLCGSAGSDMVNGGSGENLAFGGKDSGQYGDRNNIDNVNAVSGFAEGGAPVNEDQEDTVAGTVFDVDFIEGEENNRIIAIEMTKIFNDVENTNLKDIQIIQVADDLYLKYPNHEYDEGSPMLKVFLAAGESYYEECRDPKPKGSGSGNSGQTGIIGGNQN
jgi:hypothetical protein